MQSIRIFLVEDDLDWLRGLSDFLQQQADFTLVAAAASSAEARSIMQQKDFQADIALFDIMLDGLPEGILLAEEVLQLVNLKVIMLTSMEEKDFIFRSFQAGVLDYQIKADFVSLPDIIRTAFHKKIPINAAVAEQMRLEFQRLKQLETAWQHKEVRDLITPSELQVLQLIEMGLTQTEIANRFVISLRTVKIHVGHILKKLNMTNSKLAAQKVKEAGGFSPENTKKGTIES
ncbi:DNA-binding response regulator [Paenibacillus psychroresistens]|uniref:DNA-binding response regulator n=1 Tax=Paenibacillus psychroresistens TaxID=1778678 RepID=A0A6B8RK02_9BACL|nr:response regulator transcription factor [Paenibacillus psychroresistens]QGQ95915.1 DNA-binding response regulator [Paenibacillus psychroresistens]